jgi:hypothetical protein
MKTGCRIAYKSFGMNFKNESKKPSKYYHLEGFNSNWYCWRQDVLDPEGNIIELWKAKDDWDRDNVLG